MMLKNMILLREKAKFNLKKLFSDEKGEVNIVAIVVLIGIAVLLALFFKEQIMALLESLFSTITTKSNEVVGG